MTQTENLVEIEKLVMNAREQARNIVVLDDQTYKMAEEMLTKIENFQKELDAGYDPIITRAYDVYIDAFDQKKLLESSLTRAKSILKPKISEYLVKNPHIPKPSWLNLDLLALAADAAGGGHCRVCGRPRS